MRRNSFLEHNRSGRALARELRYRKAIFQHLDPKRVWQELCPSLPLDSKEIELHVTYGHAIAGAIAARFSPKSVKPAIWLVSSKAEQKALKELVKNPQAFVIPMPLNEECLQKAFTEQWTDEFTSKRLEFFRKHRLDPQLPTFFFSGRISPRKGVLDFIHLVEKQKFNCQLLLAGVWTDARPMTAFKKAIYESTYCEIREFGFLAYQKNLEMLSFSDCVLALSTDGCEDFGFLPREALALGKPVLMTQWGGFKDIKLSTNAEKKMIHRLSVRLDAKNVPRPFFGKFNLEKFFEEIRSLSKRERIICSQNLLKNQRESLRKELFRTLKCYQTVSRDKNKERYFPVFKDFAREMVLIAGPSGEINPNLHYSVKKQLQFMT